MLLPIFCRSIPAGNAHDWMLSRQRHEVVTALSGTDAGYGSGNSDQPDVRGHPVVPGKTEPAVARKKERLAPGTENDRCRQDQLPTLLQGIFHFVVVEALAPLGL